MDGIYTEKRQWDIVVLGATGRIGNLICNYLAFRMSRVSFVSSNFFESNHYKLNFNFAISGRNQNKLKQLRKHLEILFHVQVPFLKIDLDDVEVVQSLNQLCSRTKLVLNCIGPYSTLMGESIIQACLESNTNYVDLCIEPSFIFNIYRKYHLLSQQRKCLIVVSCGFESGAVDIGVDYLRRLFLPGEMYSVECYFKLQRVFFRLTNGFWSSLLVNHSLHSIKESPFWRDTQSRWEPMNNRIRPRTHFSLANNRWSTTTVNYSSALIVQRTNDFSEHRNRYLQFNYYLSTRTFLYLVILLALIFIVSFLAKLELVWKRFQSICKRYEKKNSNEARYEEHFLIENLPNFVVRNDILNKAGTAIRTYPSTVRLKNCQSTSILLVGLGSHSPLVASSSNSEPKLEILLKVQGPKGADFYECSAILAANTALAILRGNEVCSLMRKFLISYTI